MDREEENEFEELCLALNSKKMILKIINIYLYFFFLPIYKEKIIKILFPNIILYIFYLFFFLFRSFIL